MDHQLLEDLIKMLRRNGVTSYECKDLKVHLGPLPVQSSDAQETKTPHNPDEDSLLYWSAQ